MTRTLRWLPLMIALSSCGDGSGPGAGIEPLRNRIVFTSDRDGGVGLYSMNPDGSDVRMIPLGLVLPFSSSVSPDGRRIAFYSQGGDIWVVGVDGSGEMNLTASPAFEADPSWSPDGGRIAFRSDSAGNYDIYTMAINGTDLQQLTFDAADEGSPTWSPDGKRIAFGSPAGIRIMNADGTNDVAITIADTISSVGRPVWSLTDRILFQGFTGSPLTNYLFSMDPDGGNLVAIAPLTVAGFFMAWSPDATQIVTDCNMEDICVINADGTGSTRIAQGANLDRFPTWSPVP